MLLTEHELNYVSFLDASQIVGASRKSFGLVLSTAKHGYTICVNWRCLVTLSINYPQNRLMSAMHMAFAENNEHIHHQSFHQRANTSVSCPLNTGCAQVNASFLVSQIRPTAQTVPLILKFCGIFCPPALFFSIR